MEKKLYDLTNPQKSILLTEQYFNNSTLNSLCGTAIFENKIDFETFRKAVNILTETNESLRIHFSTDNSGFKQYVSNIHEINVSSTTLKSKDELKNLESSVISKTFELLDSDLFVFHLFNLPDNTSGFILNMHHLISDAWTLGLTCRKVVKIYEQLIQNKTNFSIEPTYLDYILTENEYFNSTKYSNDKKYWEEMFVSTPNIVNLYNSNNNSVRSISSDGHRLSFTFSKKEMTKISNLCSANKISVFNFFMAILSIFIYKMTSTNDFAIGTPIFNRTNFNEKNTIGMFVNVVPLLIHIDEKETFINFSKKIAVNSMGLLRHQRYPNSEILKYVRKSNPDFPNLYNILLSYQITKANNESEFTYTTKWNFNGNCANDIDIQLYDLDETGELSVAIDYNKSKYTETHINDLFKRFSYIIKQVINNESININNISLLLDEEKNKILNELNNTKVIYDTSKTISILFEEQAQKTPNNIALVFGDNSLTYKELNEKANSLAYCLRNNLNIKPNDLVGIMINRSLEMIIAILAVLKSGAAYIPIDPNYPTERVNYMLSYSKAKVLLTSKKLNNKIDYSSKLNIDLNNSSIYNFPNNNLKNINNPEDLSYVIFTSGSTGLPKGVMLKHKSLSNLTNYCNNYIEYLKEPIYQAVASITTVSFDIFIFETLISLQKGLKLIIANETEQTDPVSLNKLIEKNNVKIIQSTPSRMQLLFNNLNNIPALSNLKYIILAGEQLPLSLIQSLHKLSNPVIYNGYGPSETTVFSTLTKMNNEFVTIGKPLDNTKIYILDENLNMLPIGNTGEIYIAGDGVGKGYLNNKELTNKSFINNPFESNSIMYKSGDIGMYSNNGDIICLGRSDYQVKIRGLRIELGEIEDKIKELEAVNSCVVVKKQDENSHEFLCAYYTSTSPIDSNTIRKYIEKYLTSYMVPQYFVQMESLPYTPNGKIDRKKLPEPEFQEIKKNIIPARNEIDSKLIRMLKELLHIENISINDSFFELGGDSLHAINLSIQIQNEFKIQMYSRDILENAIIQDISDIISNKLNTSGEKNIEIPKIKKVPKAEFYDISSAQKRMYFSSTLAGGDSILYNIPSVILIEGKVDFSKLEKCFNTLIERHESLRTYFEMKNENIVQKILDNVKFKLDIKSNVNFDDLQSNLKDFIKPFDLSKAPLFRAKYIEFTNGNSAILTDMHHIISDGASLSILANEISKIYNDETLEPINITYKDFSEFEKKEFKSEFYKEAEDYWLQKFSGEIPVLNMPTTYSRPLVQSFEGKKIYSLIDFNMKQKLDNVAHSLESTPYMILLSAYYILLSKYSFQDDIIVGSPVVGRNILETKNLIGMFVNTLPLRNQIIKKQSFKDFVLTVKENVLAAYKYQIYPFNELVNKLNIKKETSRNALFDVMFIYQNNKLDSIKFDNMASEYCIPDTGISKFDLSLEALPINNEIKLSFEYSSKLFDESFIKKLSNNYLCLLNNVLNNVNITIEDISIISNNEKSIILEEFNNKTANYDKSKTISMLFEEQVNKTPNNIALVFENQTLTYKELNEKANSLAYYLRNTVNVKPDDFIGIMVNRSLEMIIAIIATLKAGACYIPIDPNYPEGRVSYMLNFSNAKILLTKENLYNKIDYKNKLNIDLKNNNIYSLPCFNLKNINTPEDLSYIIFTSGSTGLPKGVMLKHKSLSNLTNYCNNYIEYLKNPIYQAVVSITTISFDIFIFETLISLQKGLKLVIANEKEQTDTASLNKLIEKNNVKIIQSTPSRMQLFVNNIKDIPAITNLKYITLAGEQLPLSLVNTLQEISGCTIYNGYGPSETTVFSTLTKMDGNTITIGKPIDNTQIYILDEKLNMLPIGCAGEIYIAGDGVGRGYLNNKELTNKSFLNNPFAPNSIMYKSGDMGMYNSNGTISCLGRIDHQIKIRGLRIELGEIEDKIKDLKAIDSCVVVKKVDSSSHEFLCAYYTVNSNINSSDIRNYIKRFLPTYMIPQYFVEMTILPYTPNGKVDRKKLPEPEIKESNKKIVSARNKIDLKLIEILKDLLNINQISIEDSFFELGGDSLHAINLSIQIQNEFKVQIYSKDIFENPIISDISDMINSKKTSNKQNIVITTIPKSDSYDISAAQKRIYFSSTLSGNDSILYNIPNVILINGKVNADKLEKCFNTLIDRHESFRTYFEMNNDIIVQKITENINFKLDKEINVNFDNLQNILNNFIKPFDLSSAPLFRAKYLEFTDGRSAILSDMHHIISDGASLSILADELSKLYNGQSLENLQITYKDFAEFEKNEFKSEFYKEAEKYWLQQFETNIPVLDFPCTYSRPVIQSYDGKKVYFSINSEMKQKIEIMAKKLDSTTYMILLSAYYVLLSIYSSQDDIIIGSPIVGRYNYQTQKLVGMFVNTLALRNKIDLKLSFKEFILSIKQNILNAYKYQIYPFDELVNKLNIKRDISRNPLFDTMFIYQNNRHNPIKFDELDSIDYVPDLGISKFDLSLEAIPTNNEIKLSFEYATKLFSEAFIMDLSNHYINILNSILDNQNIKIEDISVLSNAEKNKILFDFNNTKEDFDKSKTISKLFEEQVEKTPNNIALVFENQKLTFKELNEKANSLAYHLRNTLNIKPNNFIGIMANRSLEVIVAMLAVLKSGGAYIPIDPTYPKDRIAYMLESSKVNILLTTEKAQNSAEFDNKILIDLNTSNVYNNPDKNLENINKQSDLIYCIFTSGSTGKPKGVLIPHRVISNFTNYCNGYVEYLKNPVYDAIASITTISFDLFVYEALISLQRGLKLIISNENEQTTPQLLNNLLEKNKATIIQTTPSVMQIFLNNLDNMPGLKNLKYVILAGEQLPLSLVQKLHELGITVYNGYGPSETHYCTLTKMDNELITIGKPICNSQMYILDKKLNPVPIGITGDIYISGDCVGNGYLNNKELTKKSFVQNPFISDTIMYKSGDLGKYLSDGNILCLGRSDHQIKIRGLRIELEEIESLILKYPNITKVSVVKQSIQNREFISAYFVASKRIAINELRKHLSKSLPRYMVPSYYTMLEDLPYTPNGKIDKKSLPLPNEILNVSKEEYIAPHTSLQRQLVTIWENILNTRPIGINDNFFELGGDSLLAMNLNIELQKISSKVTYQDIFKFATIAELEDLINSGESKSSYKKIENLPEDFIDILGKTKKLKKINKSIPKNILLTGVTGFLGIHLLDELLKIKDTKVYCIIRNEPGITANSKLYQKLNYYFGDKYNDLIGKRIFAITGDISKTGFGIEQGELLNLANSIDVIINSAANVAHYGKYSKFYNTNVLSVKNIIDFCITFKKKLFHISTMGVAGRLLDSSFLKPTKKVKVKFDESDLYIGQEPENIYTYTKFEAEVLILNALKNGLDGYILRMGNLMPRYIDGVFQENLSDNAFINRLASMVRIGIVPDYMLHNELEFTPVDCAAKSVCKILTHTTTSNRIFHLYNHKTISVEKCLKIVKKLGFDIKVLPEEEFIKHIKNILDGDDYQNLLKIIIDDFDKNMHINYNTDMKLKSNFTITYLLRTFFMWPKINAKYLNKSINILRRII